jgi:S-disulfanyl-L-cysteine oxidoreductase SoxD
MGASTMRLPLRLPAIVAFLGCAALAHSQTYGVGKTPTKEEIRAWDISISPTGEELPPGHGTAKEGALVYEQKGCAACHGAKGVDGPAPRLVKLEKGPNADPWDLGRILPIRAPYATGIWDYINRGMPLGAEGTLTADEVYALTAYLLHINDLIPEDKVIDAESLPKIQMPNRNAFAPLPDWKHGKPRMPGYPY